TRRSSDLELRAFAVAATPAIASPTRKAGPATAAATPVTTKMPAPIIAPTPTPTASNNPRSRRSSGGRVSWTAFLDIFVRLSLEQNDRDVVAIEEGYPRSN